MKSSTLYERNLFYQQLHFKYVLLQYLNSIVWKIRSNRKSRTIGLTLSFLLLHSIDFIIGATLFLTLIRNPGIKYQMGKMLAYYTKYMLDLSKDYIIWLMGVPWGIKLNTPLSQFLGTRYLYILELWRLFYSEFISIYLSMFVNFLVILLPFGITLPVTALHDFLKFLNLCLICFFIISNRVFTLQFSALKSLGRLFMGKKWNILRERVDSCDYNMNQLLVGTMIFTILLFLLPTTGMYTLIFLYLRVLQFSVQFALRVCAVFVNKLIISSLSSLYASLQDQPITKAKVLIRGLTPDEYARNERTLPYRVVDGRQCKLECYSVDDSDITVVWNGKEYPVDQMREIINRMPEESLAKEVEQCYGTGQSTALEGSIGAVVSNHSMSHWFWNLPKN